MMVDVLMLAVIRVARLHSQIHKVPEWGSRAITPTQTLCLEIFGTVREMALNGLEMVEGRFGNC